MKHIGIYYIYIINSQQNNTLVKINNALLYQALSKQIINMYVKPTLIYKPGKPFDHCNYSHASNAFPFS